MSVNDFFRLPPVWMENVLVAVSSVKGNRLRSFLTILIIATGITSLVGALTATDAVKGEVFSSFEKMGTASFTITNKRLSSSSLIGGERVRNANCITFRQALLFKDHSDCNGIVSIFAGVNGIPVKYGSRTLSNPMTLAVAADEDYLNYKKVEIERGRSFTDREMASGRPVCLLGYEVAKSLFGNEDPVGKEISLAGVSYMVEGTLCKMGGAFGGSVDNEIVVPLPYARENFLPDGISFTIGISPANGSEEIYDDAELLFRAIRRLSPGDKSDFSVNRSDAIIEELSEITDVITIAAAVIGLVTLLGAATGLMNIMLVSVKERTREIGIRKAVGASSRYIKIQFLVEAVVISQLGCLLGVVAGVAVGNLVALLMGASFIMPWFWILFAVAVCIAVGVASGYLPAVRAAALDPIVALRDE